MFALLLHCAHRAEPSMDGHGDNVDFLGNFKLKHGSLLLHSDA